MPRTRSSLGVVTAALVALTPSRGAAEGWPSALFDTPVRVEKAAEAVAQAPAREVTCTIYPDLMVRERDTDTPDPDAAVLVRIDGGPPPDCKASPGPAARRLETGGQRFLGRHGSYLFFEEASTHGVVPFTVLDVATGRELLSDSTADGGVSTFSVENGALRLGFKRGVNGGCSIPKQGAACWARIAREEKLPEAVVKPGPPTRACAEAYRAGKAPKDAESIVLFDVSLTWTGASPAVVQASGPVGCRPTP